MADSDPVSNFQSNALRPRHISGSLFNIPGFLYGLNSRASPDSDLVWSPTSVLDFGFFSSLSNPFSRQPKSPSQLDHQKKWAGDKVGLGIINLFAEETEPRGYLDSPNRKHIIFGPQVKTRHSARSKSLPRNYILSLPFQNNGPIAESAKLGVVYGDESLPPATLTPKPNLHSKSFSLKNRLETMTSLPLLSEEVSQLESSSEIKASSLPIPIGSIQRYVGSLREIELSEDYTCVISHGPNPKTTHIFGDCVLECHVSELSSFDKMVDVETEVPQEAKRPECSIQCQSGDYFDFCYSCKKKLEDGDDMRVCRGERAFCSFSFDEKEPDKTHGCSSPKSSPISSYHEDHFLIGVPIST